MRSQWTARDKEIWDRRMDAMFHATHGNWPRLLACMGVDEKILRRKNLPCPLCQDGTDRFQFTDKFGDGNYHCRKCGSGGGFKLLQAIKGWSAGETLRAIESWLGTPDAYAQGSPRAELPSEQKLRRAIEMWGEGLPIRPDDPVDRYIRRTLGTGLDVYPASLRLHPCLPYYEAVEDGKYRRLGEFPAMLGKMVAPDGSFAALMRIWLTADGQKARVPEPKKIMGDGYGGAAVRFAEVDGEEMMAGEGLENSMAVFIRFGIPTWSALNAGNLQKMWIPPQVRRFWIYGDNDANTDFSGQAAVFNLARDFMRKGQPGDGREAYPMIPKKRGGDWKEVLRHSLQHAERKRRAPAAAPPRAVHSV